MTNCSVAEKKFDRAVTLLRSGGVVAFPTESWYGLAVDPFNPEALDLLYAIKKRPAEKPILLLVSGQEDLKSLVRSIPQPFLILMEHFWPGPLTLVFPAQSNLPDRLTAGTGTVAVRCSSNPVAGQLIAQFGRPITGTSANLSGTPPQQTAAGVAENLDNNLDMILDAGPTPGGECSTIVAYRKEKLVCVRKGQVPFAAVNAAVG